MTIRDHLMYSTTKISSSGEDTNAKEEDCRCAKSSHQQLVDYHSLPHFLKHNEFIVNYYRSEWPLKQSILSVFSIHNETINVWTHLIGFFIFLALTTIAAMQMGSTDSGSALQQWTATRIQTLNLTTMMHHHIAYSTINTTSEPLTVLTMLHPPTETMVARWPFYAYLCGAMFCLLMSSACHLLSCHSEHTCYVMLRLDYAGISALIVTSFYPVVYYSFACHPFFRTLYIVSITLFGVATILISLVPVFETPGFRMVRAVLFAGMGISGLVPILHKVLIFGDRPEAMVTAGYEAVMGAFYGMGVVVYAARIPERWMPGRFDLAGHSHQLFHVLVIAGAYTHYLAGLVYLSWREVERCG